MGCLPASGVVDVGIEQANLVVTQMDDMTQLVSATLRLPAAKRAAPYSRHCGGAEMSWDVQQVMCEKPGRTFSVRIMAGE